MALAMVGYFSVQSLARELGFALSGHRAGRASGTHRALIRGATREFVIHFAGLKKGARWSQSPSPEAKRRHIEPHRVHDVADFDPSGFLGGADLWRRTLVYRGSKTGRNRPL
jgi:hypothetical protein